MSSVQNSGTGAKLPSPRISFKNQIKLLRSYAAATEADGGPVSISKAADIAGMAASSASLNNAFYLDVGLLERSGKQFIPAPEVTSFGRVSQWNPETAGSELRPLLEKTWFARALVPKLALNPLQKADALIELAKGAAVAPNRQSELEMLLDYLELAGVIDVENGQISLTQAGPHDAPSSPAKEEKEPESPQVRRIYGGSVSSSRSQVPMLIQGLLQELPDDGHWTHAKSEKWLEMAKLTFELVYTFDDDSGENLEPELHRGGNA